MVHVCLPGRLLCWVPFVFLFSVVEGFINRSIDGSNSFFFLWQLATFHYLLPNHFTELHFTSLHSSAFPYFNIIFYNSVMHQCMCQGVGVVVAPKQHYFGGACATVAVAPLVLQYYTDTSLPFLSFLRVVTDKQTKTVEGKVCSNLKQMLRGKWLCIFDYNIG